MPPSLAIYRDISYLHPFDRHRTFDLFVPAPQRSQPIPLLVFLHGGAWRSGDKEEYHAQARFWASNRAYPLAVAVINYRLSTPDESNEPIVWPDHVYDCAAALKWFRYPGRSAFYGFDADRIFLAGHSAGAQLANVLVLDPRWLGDDWRSVRGVIGVQGIYDIPRLVETWKPYRAFVEAAFGSYEQQGGKNWVYGSPQYLLLPENYRMPPQLLIHSPEDDVLDGEQAERYRDHLRTIVLKEATAPGLPTPDPERRVQLVTQMTGGHYEVLFTPEFTALVVGFVESVFPAAKDSGRMQSLPNVPQAATPTIALGSPAQTASPPLSAQTSRSAIHLPSPTSGSMPASNGSATAPSSLSLSLSGAALVASPTALSETASPPAKSPASLSREQSSGSMGSDKGKKSSLASIFGIAKAKVLVGKKVG